MDYADRLDMMEDDCDIEGYYTHDSVRDKDYHITAEEAIDIIEDVTWNDNGRHYGRIVPARELAINAIKFMDEVNKLGLTLDKIKKLSNNLKCEKPSCYIPGNNNLCKVSLKGSTLCALCNFSHSMN